MREGARALLVPGIVFLVLGALFFVVSERVLVKVELFPFSFLLIMLLVAGAILFGSGILMFVSDRF